LQDMFEESWAIDFGKEWILHHSQKAKTILAKTELNDDAKAWVLGLIKKMEKLEH
jgi:hypothetical protein